jgi:hypothetical protein
VNAYRPDKAIQAVLAQINADQKVQLSYADAATVAPFVLPNQPSIATSSPEEQLALQALQEERTRAILDQQRFAREFKTGVEGQLATARAASALIPQGPAGVPPINPVVTELRKRAEETATKQIDTLLKDSIAATTAQLDQQVSDETNKLLAKRIDTRAKSRLPLATAKLAEFIAAPAGDPVTNTGYSLFYSALTNYFFDGKLPRDTLAEWDRSHTVADPLTGKSKVDQASYDAARLAEDLIKETLGTDYSKADLDFSVLTKEEQQIWRDMLLAQRRADKLPALEEAAAQVDAAAKKIAPPDGYNRGEEYVASPTNAPLLNDPRWQKFYDSLPRSDRQYVEASLEDQLFANGPNKTKPSHTPIRVKYTDDGGVEYTLGYVTTKFDAFGNKVS